MMQIQTILHPTDFSAASRPAFGLACALARDYGAHLILLHVAPAPVVMGGEMGVVPVAPVDDREALWEQLTALTPTDAAVRVEHRLRVGGAAEQIVAVATDEACDLIVIGTHGRTGLRRLLMGSVAEAVLRQASCPVLTVKTPTPEGLTVPATAGTVATV
jgi:nucleotide-binding universal stress UspA family protein